MQLVPFFVAERPLRIPGVCVRPARRVIDRHDGEAVIGLARQGRRARAVGRQQILGHAPVFLGHRPARGRTPQSRIRAPAPQNAASDHPASSAAAFRPPGCAGDRRGTARRRHMQKLKCAVSRSPSMICAQLHSNSCLVTKRWVAGTQANSSAGVPAVACPAVSRRPAPDRPRHLAEFPHG